MSGLFNLASIFDDDTEPSTRPVATLPSAPGAGADGLAGSVADANPLYLLGLAGSVMTKQPGEGATLAERMLPAYMQTQARNQEINRKQALSEAEAAEYNMLQ